jgi:peptide/nickel transport system permease protein
VKDRAETPAAHPSEGPWPRHEATQRRRTRLFADPLTRLGLALLSVYVLLAVAAPLIARHDPLRNDLPRALQDPSWLYLLGTDNLGRSLFARVVYGARISLSVSLLTLLLMLVIGVGVGALAGYYRGRLDSLLMRLVDIFLAFPSLVLVLAIAGMLGPSLVNIVIALTAVEWVRYARVVRGQVLELSQLEYVEAAKALGVPHHRVIWRHIVPNVLSPVVVLATLDLGYIILAISSLSFLGLGAQAPTPEWGRMLSDAAPYMQFAPRLMIVPGAAIFMVVLACNLLGDGLRDVLDPKAKS